MIGSLVVKYPYSIMTAPDIAKVADLKGKRVILPFEKDLLTVVWNRWVTEQGMRPTDIEQVYAGATPNRLAALSSGSVQAALLRRRQVREGRRLAGLAKAAQGRPALCQP